MALLARRYELGALLGRGAHGVVHRARDTQLGRDVAIKILLEAPDDASEQEHLLREARVAARFHHPGACEVYEIGVVDERPYIVMELVAGAPLASAMTGARLPLPATLAIGRALADVLVAAHAIGLVHRDLKPQNVVFEGPIESPTRVRVIDFGLAFLIAPPSAQLGRLSEDGALSGTPAYMAPEQIAARPIITPAADLYALGCILYEAATGRTPFVGAMNRVLAGHLYLPPIPPSEVDPANPPALDTALLAALAKDPAARPTAVAFAATLRALALGEGARSASSLARGERAVAPARPSSVALASPARAPIRIALAEPTDRVLADALAALGAPLVDPADADVLVIAFAPGATVPARRAATPVVGIASAPTPDTIKHAIRAGLAGVIRLPATADALAAKLAPYR